MLLETQFGFGKFFTAEKLCFQFWSVFPEWKPLLSVSKSSFCSARM